MYIPNLVSILFYDQPLSIFKFDDVMPTSRICSILEALMPVLMDIIFQHKLFLFYLKSYTSKVANIPKTLHEAKFLPEKIITTFLEDKSQLLDPHPGCCKCIRNVKPIII